MSVDDHRATTPAAPSVVDGRPASPTPRPRRRATTVVLVAAAFLAGSLVSGAGAVWASHTFTDVPTSNQFHDDIDWMATNGISTGYVDGTFRPDAPVSRQAMAAFMHRLSNRTTLHNGSVDPGPATGYSLTVNCPTGSRPIAGGGETDVADLLIADSAPLSTGTAGWKVRWITRDGGVVDAGEVKVWVTCVPLA